MISTLSLGHREAQAALQAIQDELARRGLAAVIAIADVHGELVALGTWVMANLQDNDPGWLANAYERTGILWQPQDIHLTRDEFVRTLATLNWYQGNFGRRYSVLNQRTVDQDFIERMVSKLQFEH